MLDTGFGIFDHCNDVQVGGVVSDIASSKSQLSQN
jgi:hypothetical protein